MTMVSLVSVMSAADLGGLWLLVLMAWHVAQELQKALMSLLSDGDQK